MKAIAFFKSGKRRLIFAGALLMITAAATVFAHGEREGEKHGDRRQKYAAGYYQIESWLAQSGFTGPLITTSEAASLADETPVRLRGNITQAFKDEQYEFRDSAGTITLKIDRRAWNGVSIDSQDEIEITGTIDKSLFKRTVDVRYIQKILPDTPQAQPESGTLPPVESSLSGGKL